MTCLAVTVGEQVFASSEASTEGRVADAVLTYHKVSKNEVARPGARGGVDGFRVDLSMLLRR